MVSLDLATAFSGAQEQTQPGPDHSVIISSVAEEVHSSATVLKFPFRSRIWSRVCKIQLMGEGEQTITLRGFFNGHVHVNLVLCPAAMHRKCFLWLLLTKNAGSQDLGFLSSVCTQ